ncbi:SPS-sensor component SSY1 [Nakaseomyces bracarensis]|uniref:SPS-sensor component SSY1 n=1 Tax=Nakaseomyces bracarensis TaxID=273131 RepID=A0ABR4NTA6_9SACH
MDDGHQLFPGRNNIEVIISDDDDDAYIDNEVTSVDPTKSIDTGVLRSIIDEEGWYDTGRYYDEIRNQRFYVTDRYLNKKRIELSDMLYSKSSDPISYQSNNLNDFEKYDLKVRKESELRDRLEDLLKNHNHDTLPVVKDSALHEKYTSPEVVNKQPKYSYAKQHLNTLKSIWPKKKSVSQHKKQSVSGATQLDAGSMSSQTYIIDDTSYGHIAINEDIDIDYAKNGSISEDIDSNTDNHSGYQKEKGNAYHRFQKMIQRRSAEQYHLQRKLKARHIQMLAIGACLSVGIFMTSGKAFSIAGPFGCLIGFILSGSVILATMMSFTELATLIPVSSGFSGLASRFVEDAFGFALGWTYWFASMVALPAQVVSCTFYFSHYQHFHLSRGGTAGFVTLFSLFPLVIHFFDVRVVGEFVYIIGLFKVIFTVAIIIIMLVINGGHGHRVEGGRVGFRYWDSGKSSLKNITYGLFRPTFDLSDLGTGSIAGIGGARGRFIAIGSVMLISTFAFSGVEMTFVASGEAKNPRKTIPSAMRRTFTFIFLIYLFLIFSVSINIYCGDPRLLSYYSGVLMERYDNIGQKVSNEWQVSYVCEETIRGHYSEIDSQSGFSSPWVLALENFGLCSFASGFNAVLIFFTSSATISSLYSSSRTLYAMSVQRKAPAIFRICNDRGIPYVAVAFSSIFAVVAYLAVDDAAVANFDVLMNIASASTSIIWLGLNVSFLRFYFALEKRKDIVSRNDVFYPYKSPVQPYLAIYGLVGCIIFVLFMGFINFIDGYWNTKSFFSSYGGLIIFCVCYLSYRIFSSSKIQRLDQLDLDTGRREIDRILWTEHRQYRGPYSEKLKKLYNWLL